MYYYSQAQDGLDLSTHAPDRTGPPAPTVPTIAVPLDSSPSDSHSAGVAGGYAPASILAGPTGQQRFAGAGGASPVVFGDRQYRPQYTPLSHVAFSPYELAHRTVENLFHPPAPTADAVPRPDWNPFATLRNWPLQVAAGLKTTIFGGPQAPTPKGRNV